ITIYNPQRIPLDIAENQIKKRLFDIVVSGLFLLLVMSWLFPLIALIVKLSSRGPVLFVQPRTGINNRTFQCYKFRSMRVNSDAHKVQATKNDPRITAIGRLMRRTNIDELPQFINVFWGDMSIVGPRPHMLAHTELFAREVDNYLVRHYVKPGITGWAQVNGYRGETKEHWQIEKRVQYDHEYIRNWTFDWDFVIVWKTLFCLKAFKNAG
ncbi:MAG: exopolysaccharide biosynthesis polyprenyl glycosylphosphotransferase, partial [Bacteroidales bacterium]|nr:exopolysaccharide biosynthesis polyprenyl glycosylphosphotransferase [Bacteroidales bacterium]